MIAVAAKAAPMNLAGFRICHSPCFNILLDHPIMNAGLSIKHRYFGIQTDKARLPRQIVDNEVFGARLTPCPARA